MDYKNLIGMHVGGSEKVLIEEIPSLIKEGFRVFQVFLADPSKWNALSKDKVIGYGKGLPGDIRLIVHSSFFINFCQGSGSKSWRASLSELVRLSEVCHVLGIKDIVTHVGSKKSEQDIKSVYYSIMSFCSKWLQRTDGLDVRLNLENDAGSKNGNKIGSVKLLYKIVTDYDNDRIGMCFDSLHSYANGMDLSKRKIINHVLNVSNVVHLNAIPEEVDKGSHLDRHSFTAIEETKCHKEDILYIAEGALKREIPIVFERQETDLSKRDYNFLIESQKKFGFS